MLLLIAERLAQTQKRWMQPSPITTRQSRSNPTMRWPTTTAASLNSGDKTLTQRLLTVIRPLRSSRTLRMPTTIVVGHSPRRERSIKLWLILTSRFHLMERIFLRTKLAARHDWKPRPGTEPLLILKRASVSTSSRLWPIAVVAWQGITKEN